MPKETPHKKVRVRFLSKKEKEKALEKLRDLGLLTEQSKPKK